MIPKVHKLYLFWMTPCPRLRPLEMFPADVDGERVLCLRDPSGLTEGMAFLPPPAVLVVSLCDGSRTRADVAREFHRRTGRRISEAQVASILDQLDEALFLETPRFLDHRRAIHEAFRAAPLRPAAHAGASYPDAPAELATLLDGHLRAAAGAGDACPPAAVVAPHIDFARGGRVYGRAWAPVAAAGGPAPDLVVVFGTDHNGIEQPFTLTRKSYDTPLGALETDGALVDALAREAGGEALFAEELHHRGEHSIEFQAVWLRHLFGGSAPPILPVLCGSVHRSVAARTSPRAGAPVRRFLEALRTLTAGRRVLVVAGADLAHVGPRFGDGPFGAAELAEVERADRAALAAAATGDAEGFFAAVAAVEDRYRVCGTSAIYATLALGEGTTRRGELLAYEHCPADEKPESFVTIAAVAVR